MSSSPRIPGHSYHDFGFDFIVVWSQDVLSVVCLVDREWITHSRFYGGFKSKRLCVSATFTGLNKPTEQLHLLNLKIWFGFTAKKRSAVVGVDVLSGATILYKKASVLKVWTIVLMFKSPQRKPFLKLFFRLWCWGLARSLVIVWNESVEFSKGSALVWSLLKCAPVDRSGSAFIILAALLGVWKVSRIRDWMSKGFSSNELWARPLLGRSVARHLS